MSSRILEERLEKIISFVVEGLTRKEIGKRDEKNLGYKLGRAAWFR